MKRILTIQDFSCLGKCSTTVALPIISAMGIETVVLPTAVLSCHTAFPQYEIIHIEDKLYDMVKCWESEDIKFDGIYVGYLGNLRAIKETEKILKKFSNDNTIVMIDPVLGDEGQLYTGFDGAYQNELNELAKMADIITPNLTEAMLLLGEDLNLINTLKKSDNYQKKLIQKLRQAGYSSAVVTGVDHRGDEKSGCKDSHEITIAAFDGMTEYHFSHEKINEKFPGTGDVFASVLMGALVREKSLEEAIEIAYKFVLDAIKCTMTEEKHNWYGINFEQALLYLINLINC